MEGRKEIVRLNVDIPKALKKRIKVYCAKEEIGIKEFVTIAIESLLDEMEKPPLVKE